MLEALTGSSFIEKAFLLILGALLTGILVPLIKLLIDRNWFRQQKRFEADIAREAEIVRARAQFLKDIVDPVWQFQLLALQVSYDVLTKKENTKAFQTYDEQSWQHLARIRTIIGGARWFTSPHAYKLLTNFVDGWLLRDVDMQLTNLTKKAEKGDWDLFHAMLYADSRTQTDDLLVALARDFNLTPDIQRDTNTIRSTPKREHAKKKAHIHKE